MVCAGSIATLLPAIPVEVGKLYIEGDVFLRLNTQASTSKHPEPVLGQALHYSLEYQGPCSTPGHPLVPFHCEQAMRNCRQ